MSSSAVDVTPENKRLLRIREVSERIGLSRTVTYKLIHGGQISATRIGHPTRFPAKSSEEWIRPLEGVS
ncbi:MAG: helix-turn-helix domain-containing protein [Armatimonadetes bacterium]|nr:helix-turn-helix domain-containing protein [Armatimonadota bacterium]